MTTRRLALVESNTTGSGRQFCAVARDRGLHPVVLTAAPQRYPYLAADRVDHEVLDTGDADAVLDACARIACLAGVTSSSEYFMATAAQVAAKLDLPAPDPAALNRCRHKDRQRAVLEQAGVPVPAFRPAGEVSRCVRVADELGYPVVVKPTTGSGSIGVRRCGTRTAVARHAAQLLGNPTDERGRPTPRLVLVERYVPGPEYSVETFDDTAVAVVAKHLGAEPHFVETGHDVPAPVPPAVAAALRATALEAIGALGLGWGAAHTELRLTADGPVVIEVNPRLAGGMIPTVVRLATGVDLVDAVVARATGHRPAPVPQAGTHASIRFVTAAAAGTVTDIAGLAEARATPGVHLAEVTVEPGTGIAVTHSFRDRVGYAVATGPDAVTAADRATRGAAHLSIATRPSTRETR
ncbi:MAG: ATP-grasp domain-containing protein [Actinobacteria bacterium]|nr:MAG: ATP-grasp domain-containing protein [Actinomycetota bacterium]